MNTENTYNVEEKVEKLIKEKASLKAGEDVFLLTHEEIRTAFTELLAAERHAICEEVKGKLQNARARYREFGLQSIEGELAALSDILSLIQGRK